MEYSIHKLNIRSDVDLDIPSYFKKKLESGKTPDLQILRGKPNTVGAHPVFPPYIYHRKNLLLHKYGFLIPCQLTLENLESATKIEFTEAYRKLVGVKDVIEAVLDFKLLQKGLVKMHGSCVELPNKTGVMIIGWDHSGKSTLALNKVERGAKFLADDITIISKDSAYSYPKNLKIFTGMNFLAKRLNSVPFANRMLGLNRAIPPKNITEKTKIKYIFISRYGKKSIRRVRPKEAAKTMDILNIYVTAPFDKRHLLLEYCHYNKYDLAALLRTRHEIIKKFLKRVKCFEITSTNVKDSEDLMKKILSKR